MFKTNEYNFTFSFKTNKMNKNTPAFRQKIATISSRHTLMSKI